MNSTFLSMLTINLINDFENHINDESSEIIAIIEIWPDN